MIITETQASGITRDYNLPDDQRNSWIEFFQWLIDNEVEPIILDFKIRN